MDTIKNEMNRKHYGSLADTVAFWITLAAVFLLPVFFIPTSSFPFLNAKAAIFAIAALAPFFAWIIRSFQQKSVTLPHAGFVYASFGLVMAAFLSSLFSQARFVSLIGDGYEFGTAGFLLLSALAIASLPSLFADRRRIFYFYLAVVASFAVVAIYQLLHILFGASFLSFGVFNDVTSNMVGKWNELAIMSGLAAILSLITLELMPLSRGIRAAFWAVLALAMLLLAAVNMGMMWIIIALATIALAAFSFKSKKSEGSIFKKISPAILAAFIVSAVFIGAGGWLGSHISNHFGIVQIEARPLWGTTWAVSKVALHANPVFGIGPNRFVNAWLTAKPAGVNQTIFWNTDFAYGIGYIPTALATMGILGALAWIAFLALFIWSGYKALKIARSKDLFARYLILSSFSVALFLWIVSFFYLPGNVTFGLTILWTGIYAAVLLSEDVIVSGALSFARSSAARIGAIAILIVSIVGSVGLGFVFAKKTLAAAYVQSAASSASRGDLDKAQSYAEKAVSLSKDGTDYRAAVTVDLYQLQKLVSSASALKNGPTDDMKAQFNSLLSSAISNALAAKDSDQTDYRNWVTLGTLYQQLIPFTIPNAYQNALASYQNAQFLNPLNPEINLDLARLEIDNKDTAKAKTYIEAAVGQKADYLDAVYLYAQIQFSEKDVPGALKSLIYATQITPNDPVLLYQIGVLFYGQADYKDAVTAFQRALTLNSGYADAHYYLGLSYDKTNDKPDAIAQFQAVLASNPDNAEVKKVIANLQAGKSALSGLTAGAGSAASSTASSAKN